MASTHTGGLNVLSGDGSVRFAAADAKIAFTATKGSTDAGQLDGDQCLVFFLGGTRGAVARGGLYDYPGDYAQRFDGIDSGGNDAADGDTLLL